jgi:hypothetical protein
MQALAGPLTGARAPLEGQAPHSTHTSGWQPNVPAADRLQQYHQGSLPAGAWPAGAPSQPWTVRWAVAAVAVHVFKGLLGP